MRSMISLMSERRRRASARSFVVPLVAVAFGAAGPAAAHHAISAVYDGSRPQRIEGIVVEFQFVNPHPFVIVTVGADGAGESWRLEMDNRFELADIGMTNATLRPGDRVVVTGSPGRTEPRTLYIRQLDRPVDGFRYEQVGSRPRVSSAPR